MKKQSLKFGLLLTALVITISACKQKENYKPAPENEISETLAEATTPINSKLPVDVFQSCTIDLSDFNNWFKKGNVTKNGVVNPANSVAFKHENNCEFYKWSEQMFLWTTSKNPSTTKINLESSDFYTVTPKINKKRSLIPHTPGANKIATTSLQKKDSRTNEEESQATGDALMSQDGKIIYYITFVNDVYAQFLTAASNDKSLGSEFPTKQSDLKSIETYLNKNDKDIKLKNPNTLAMEIKTSWVELKASEDSSNFITINAEVPTYTKTDKLWTPKSTDKPVVKTLALVGMHIVGSVAGHPEMIWATFEHHNNSPNLSYQYLDNQSQTKTVNADTGNDWLLNNDSSSETYNESHMKYDSKNGNIKATPNNKISGSNTKMINAFGVAFNNVPNPENSTSAASNSQVISINNSVLGKLIDGDVRKNYVFIGATWTDNGSAPNGESYSAKNSKTPQGFAIGTSQLANSTMETYAQYGSDFGKNASCFSCHSNFTTPGLKPTDLSHIYGDITPLSEN